MDRPLLDKGVWLRETYLIESVLGQGGMGTVYLALRQDQTSVAVKELYSLAGEAQERQFRREAEILSRVHHPALVPIRDFFEEQQRLYLVMDFIEGETLSLVGRRKSSGDLRQILEWSYQLCGVLMALHDHDPPILFRDLKPSNIIVDRQRRLRLIDFGIARFQVEGQQTTSFLKGVGSTGFAPLEQYGEESTDIRSDIYSLGATIYFMLTRRVPETPINRVASGLPLTSIRLANPQVSPELESVVLKMLSLRKEDRFPNCQEVLSALKGAAKPESVPPPPQFQVRQPMALPSLHLEAAPEPQTSPWLGRRKSLLMALVVIVLLLLGLVLESRLKS